MKYSLGLILLSFMFLISNYGIAQRGRPPERPYRPDRPRPERLEKFRKMRLVEVLKLNEDDAIRFFAKQGAHEDKMREMMKSRHATLDNIEDMVREKGDSKEMSGLTDKVLDLDQKMFGERQRYQDELRKFLTPEQFAKFLGD